MRDKLITEDDERRLVQQLQKLTDDKVKQIESVLNSKEKELMDF